MKRKDATREELSEEIKRLRERLDRTENELATFRSIFDNIREEIWRFDTQSNPVYITAGVEDIYGYSPEEAMRLNPVDFFPERFHSEIKARIADLLAGKSVTDLPLIGKRKDGTEIPVIIEAFPVFEGDEIVGFQGITKDATEKARYQNELKIQKEKYEALYNRAPLPYQSLNPKGEIIDVNPRWLEILEYGRDDVMSKPFRKFITPKSREIFSKRFPEFLQAGKVSDVHFEMIKKSGDTIDVLFEGVVAYDSAGNPKQTYCVFKDITESLAVERRLQNSEHKFRTLFEGSRDGLFLHEIGSPGGDVGKIVETNQRFCEMLGFTKDEIIGKTIKEISPEVTEDLAADRYRKLYTEGFVKFESRHKRKTGELIDVEVNSSFISIDGRNLVVAASREIEERKKQIAELRDSREQNKALSEAAMEAIIFSDKGYCIDCNKTTCQMFGYTYDEFVGKFGTEVIADEHKSLVAKNMKISNVGPYEALAQRKDGSKFWAEFRGKNYVYKGKKVRVTAVRDITERKKFEEELKFRSLLLDQIQDVVTATDLEGKITYLNKASMESTDFTKDELIGKNVIELGEDPAEGATQQEIIDETLKNGYWRGKIVNISKAARRIYFDTRTQLVRDENDEPVGMVGISSDITKQVEYEKRLNRIFKKSPVGIVITKQRKIEFANNTAIQILGYEKPETKGADTYAIYQSREQYEKIGELMYENLESGYSEIETKFVRKDGREIDVLIKSAYLNEKEFDKEIVHIIQDVTEDLKMEAELIEAKQRAEQSDVLKSAFLANMSHEIRTPMNSIVGFAKMLEFDDLEPEERREYIEIIKTGSERLITVIEDVIEISKIESGDIKVEEKEFNINSLLREVKGDFIKESLKKGLELNLSLGSEDSEGVILGDANRIKQILRNLLDNALKFTAQGEIDFGYVLSEGRIELFVEDTGIGISPEYREIIFERFRQIETSLSRQYGGTGLGLAIVKAVVDKLGGEIRVDTGFSGGARFSVVLPVKSTGSVDIAEPNLIEKGTKTDFGGLTFLVVEDEITNYKLLERILKKRNASVIRARNGEEAVRMCRENADIDLVLMDLKLPVMDGLQATGIIKSFAPELPIIAQTAHALFEDKDKALDAGCDDYISKPISIEKLLEITSKFLK